MELEILKQIWNLKQYMKKKNIGAFASSTAFFLFISMIPMLALLCAMIPFTGITESDLMRFLTEITPDAMDAFMVSLIEGVYDPSAHIASIAALMLLWSSGKGMLALIRGLNEINDVEESRGYFVLRGIASFYTMLFLMLTVLTLIVMVFGNVLVYIICRTVPGTEGFFEFLMYFRLVFILVVMSIFFSVMYTYIPDKKLRFRCQIPGAVFSAIVWNLFSLGFSVYVEKMNGFSLYGNLAAIVMLMLWLYMCLYILMTGACINRYFSSGISRILRKC